MLLNPELTWQVCICFYLQGVKKYTLGNRLSCLLVKFGEYSVAGFGCGLLGQGIANSLMMAK